MTILQREPFVAKLYAAFQSKTNLYLVMRYIDDGDCAALDKPLDAKGILQMSLLRSQLNRNVGRDAG